MAGSIFFFNFNILTHVLTQFFFSPKTKPNKPKALGFGLLIDY